MTTHQQSTIFGKRFLENDFLKLFLFFSMFVSKIKDEQHGAGI